MKDTSKDSKILFEIQEIISKRSTYGYRRITAVLQKKYQEKGLPPINHKRVYRIMRENQLLLPKYGKRKNKVHDGKIITLRSNIRWCSDGFGLQCFNGERVQVAFILDCHDREVISWISSTRGIDSIMVQDMMTEAIEKRFGKVKKVPHYIQFLSDNGPCYTSRNTVEFGKSLGFEICTTAPYSPESNGMAEALVKTIKRDYAYCSELNSSEQVMKNLDLWFEDYNNHAPHKGLRMLSPREYRQKMNLEECDKLSPSLRVG